MAWFERGTDFPIPFTQNDFSWCFESTAWDSIIWAMIQNEPLCIRRNILNSALASSRSRAHSQCNGYTSYSNVFHSIFRLSVCIIINYYHHHHYECCWPVVQHYFLIYFIWVVPGGGCKIGWRLFVRTNENYNKKKMNKDAHERKQCTISQIAVVGSADGRRATNAQPKSFLERPFARTGRAWKE